MQKGMCYYVLKRADWCSFLHVANVRFVIYSKHDAK